MIPTFARLGGTLALLAFGLSAPGAAAGPLHPLKSNPIYFTDGSGKAVYLAGSHTWPNFATDQGPAKFDYDGYLDFLTAHNLNFFRAWTWDVPTSKQGINGGPFTWDPLAYQRTGPGLATDGKPKFDLNAFNQAFFDRVRARTIEAGDRKIYVAIMLFQGFAWQYNRTDQDGFPLDGRNNINGIDAGPGDDVSTLKNPAVTAVQEAYIRKLIDTVNDLDNVLYEITNESGPKSTAWQHHLIDYIHQYERTKPKQHPVGMTYQYEGGKQEDLYASNADWISPDCTEKFREDPPVPDGSKVIVFDTDHGYGWQILKQDGPARHQIWAWKNFCRGNQTLFMDPYLAKPFGKSGERNHPLGENPVDPYFGLTPDPYYEPLRTAMGRARAFGQKINLAEMKPRKELASTAYCLAQPGREYVVYNPGAGRRFTVKLVAGAYDFEWFNPTTGITVDRGRLTVEAGERSFAAPFAGDAVLYLKKADR